MQIKQNIETMRPDLICDYEEADRMLVAYASQVSNEGVMVRSPPGNIVVVTLFVYYAMNCDSGTFINNGTGPKRKLRISITATFQPNKEAQSLVSTASLDTIICLVSSGREEQHVETKRVRTQITFLHFHCLVEPVMSTWILRSTLKNMYTAEEK